jgi:hypothetical protein
MQVYIKTTTPQGLNKSFLIILYLLRLFECSIVRCSLFKVLFLIFYLYTLFFELVNSTKQEFMQ